MLCSGPVPWGACPARRARGAPLRRPRRSPTWRVMARRRGRHGRGRRRPGHPVRGRSWASARKDVAKAMDNLPAGAGDRAAGAADHASSTPTATDRDRLRPEPHQRLAQARSRARWSRRSSRSRTTASTSTARSTSRARCAPSSPTRPTASVVQGGSSITQQMVKLTLLQPGEDQGGAARRRPTTPTPARSASCATRSPSSRTTPRTGSWSATSTSPTSVTAPTASSRPPATTSTTNAKRAQPAPVGDARRPGQEPHRLRPDQLPRQGARASQHRAATGWPQLTSSPQAEAEQAQGQEARAQGPDAQQRLPRLAGPVLLRLRLATTCSRTRRSARPSSERKQLLKTGGLTIHTTIDLDVPGGRRQRRSPTTSTRPTRRSARLAMVEPGTGDVWRSPSRGRWARRRRRARPSSTTSSPSEYGDSTASRPARRSRCSSWPPRWSRASRSTHDQRRRSKIQIHDVRVRRLRRRALPATAPGTSPTPRRAGPRRSTPAPASRSTPSSPQLERAPASASPSSWPSKMGVELTHPKPTRTTRRRAGPVVHPRRRRRQPAGDGRGLRHLRRPRPALRHAGR